MTQQEKLKKIENFEIEIKIPIEDPERIMKSLMIRGFQKYQKVIEENSIKMDERRVMILALNKRKYDAAGKVKENREF